MVRVQVVVGDGQKSKWETHVEETPSLDSVSDLIRTAVEEYIATDDSPGEGLNDEVVADIKEDLDALHGDIGQLQDTLKLLRLENVKEEEMEEVVQYAALRGVEEFFNDYDEDAEEEWMQ